MTAKIFSSNDNRKYLISSLMVSYLVSASPAVALQLPQLPLKRQVAAKPAAAVAPPPITRAAAPAPNAPPQPPLLPGQVGKDFAECMTMANSALAKGMYQMAADNYRAAVKFNPNEAAGHLGLGHALHGLAQDDEALQEYFEALEHKSDPVTEAKTRFGLGIIMMKRERWDEAAGQFLQIIKIAPNDLATRGQLGICYEQKGQIDPALEQFKYIVATDPKNVDGHYNLAVAYDLKEDFSNAAAEYRKCIELNPKHSMAYVGLGNCLINTRTYGDAVKIGQLAIKIDPKNYYVLIMMGRAYELMGKEDDAVKVYNRSITLAPKAPENQKLMQNMLKMRAKKLGLNNLLPGLN